MPGIHSGWNILYLYLLIAGVLILRIYVEETSYISHDSHFYLKIAKKIKKGENLEVPLSYPFKNAEHYQYYSRWPIGYGLIIAFISIITGTTVFVASKIVNFLFLGLIFLVFYKWWGPLSWFPALGFCTFTGLEIFSYSWSEGPFIFFMILLCYILSKSHNQPLNNLFIYIAMLLTCLFLIRYAGLILYFYVFLLGVYFYRKQKHRLAYHLISGSVIAGLIAGGYLMHNYYQTNYFFGMQWVFLEKETFLHFLTEIWQSLLNEFTLIRNYYFSGYTDYLYLFLLFIQMALILYLLIKKIKGQYRLSFRHSVEPIYLISCGLVFLAGITLTRYFSPVQAYNHRILGPFSICLLTGLLSSLIQPVNRKFFNVSWAYITIFFLLSLLMNLPKKYIITSLTGN